MKRENPFQSKNKYKPKKPKTDKEAKTSVKLMFITWFKNKKAKEGFVMTPSDIKTTIIKRLDKEETSLLEEAMNDLVEEGFMTIKADGLTLVLTSRGPSFYK